VENAGLTGWAGNLAEHLKDYEYSSARLYMKNRLDGFLPVHFEELS